MKSFYRGSKIDYEILLRTIGQQLENEQVDSFAVEIEGKKVFISGGSGVLKPENFQRGNKSNINRTNSERIVKADDLKSEDRRFHLSPRTFRGCYSIEDIYRLDKEGKAKRKDQDRIPNGQSISQVLRAMGAYVSRKEARLYSVAVRDGSIEIVYETDVGKQSKDIFKWPT